MGCFSPILGWSKNHVSQTLISEMAPPLNRNGTCTPVLTSIWQ